MTTKFSREEIREFEELEALHMKEEPSFSLHLAVPPSERHREYLMEKVEFLNSRPDLSWSTFRPEDMFGNLVETGSSRQKDRPGKSDAVLVSLMDGGKRPEIARQAGARSSAAENDADDESESSSSSSTGRSKKK
jgi:hypothetical protein